MTRVDFQRLTRIRLRDARALLRAGNNEGAYYLTGLAVECGLKSAIARKTRRHDFPPEPKIVSKQIYVHDLNTLLATAGLVQALEVAANADPALKANWALIKDWTYESRYSLSITGAEGLYRAATGRNGVLRWLRQHW